MGAFRLRDRGAAGRASARIGGKRAPAGQPSARRPNHLKVPAGGTDRGSFASWIRQASAWKITIQDVAVIVPCTPAWGGAGSALRAALSATDARSQGCRTASGLKQACV